MKLLTIKCYDWSSKLANKMCAASIVRMNSAKKNKCWKQASHSKPNHSIDVWTLVRKASVELFILAEVYAHLGTCVDLAAILGLSVC